MIAWLSGILLEKSPERIIVDVQGVGYEARVPLSTFAALPPPGEAVQVLIHTHVREDSLTLFGFATPTERHLFEKMISVSGVGPKLALALLSGLSPEELTDAIRSGSPAPLARVPGIGRKTAERLVVDLRDKLTPAVVGVDPEAAGRGLGVPGGEGERTLMADVHSALLNLGYTARAAERALDEARRSVLGTQVPADGRKPTFEEFLKEALRSAAAVR